MACTSNVLCVYEDGVQNSPSLRMPTLKHFLRRQYWHWLRWCWSIGQLRLPLQEYCRFRRTDRLKKLLQPEGEEGAC